MGVLTVGAYSITTVRAELRGSFWDEPRQNAFFEYKIGEGGGVIRVLVGLVDPGIHGKIIVQLNQNTLYYFRFGILYYTEWKWGFWLTFNTLNMNVKTLEVQIEAPTKAIGGVEWLMGNFYAHLEYKKGEEGSVTRLSSGLRIPSPYRARMWLYYPNSIYYCRGGIWFESGTFRYYIWGDWIMFHNAPYVYHYRAYAIGDDGLKHIGEDKYFMPKF